MSKFSKEQLDETVPFAEFLDYITTSQDRLATANKHWRPIYLVSIWWRHDKEVLSSLMVLCEGSTGTDRFQIVRTSCALMSFIPCYQSHVLRLRIHQDVLSLDFATYRSLEIGSLFFSIALKFDYRICSSGTPVNIQSNTIMHSVSNTGDWNGIWNTFLTTRAGKKKNTRHFQITCCIHAREQRCFVSL